MFKEWLKKVNLELLSTFGVGVNDIPDAPWWGWFDDDLTPSEAIEAYAYDWDDTGMMVDILDS